MPDIELGPRGTGLIRNRTDQTQFHHESPLSFSRCRLKESFFGEHTRSKVIVMMNIESPTRRAWLSPEKDKLSFNFLNSFPFSNGPCSQGRQEAPPASTLSRASITSVCQVLHACRPSNRYSTLEMIPCPHPHIDSGALTPMMPSTTLSTICVAPVSASLALDRALSSLSTRQRV